MREEGIDSMKYRKSTHLAGVDVEGIIADKGKCILIIKQSYYDTNVNVSGIKVKYILPTNNTDDKTALAMLNDCKTLGELKTTWSALTPEEKTLPTVLAKKESLKNKLK